MCIYICINIHLIIMHSCQYTQREFLTKYYKQEKWGATCPPIPKGGDLADGMAVYPIRRQAMDRVVAAFVFQCLFEGLPSILQIGKAWAGYAAFTQ